MGCHFRLRTDLRWEGEHCDRKGRAGECCPRRGAATPTVNGLEVRPENKKREDACTFCVYGPLSGDFRFFPRPVIQSARRPAHLAALAANSQYSCPGVSMLERLFRSISSRN